MSVRCDIADDGAYNRRTVEREGHEMGSGEAGWYADPTDTGRLRFFDGSGWTDHVRTSSTNGSGSSSVTGSPLTSEPFGIASGTRRRPRYDRKIDLSLSGSVTLVDLLLHVLLRWLLVAIVSSVLIGPVSMVIAVAGRSKVAVAVALMIDIIVPLVAAFASLCKPVRTGKAEYARLVDSRAGSGSDVRSALRERLQQRRAPLTAVDAKQVSTGPSEAKRELLLVRRDKLEVWVLAADSGADLWVGWTAWIRQRPIVMPFTYAKQLLNRALGKGSTFHEAIRQSEARATLMAIHHSVVDIVDDLAGAAPSAPRDVPHASNGSTPVRAVVATAAGPGSGSASASGWWAG